MEGGRNSTASLLLKKEEELKAKVNVVSQWEN